MSRLKIFFSMFFLLLMFTLSATAKQFTLVIDPGHGGNDPGAVGALTKEKTINLNVALALGKMVESKCSDVKVIYTRKTDVFVTLQERANIANKAKADLFISIHTNSVAQNGAGALGAETYTLGMHRAADNLEVAKRENSVITMEKNYKQTYQGFDPKKAESYIIFELMQDKHMSQSVKLAKAIQQQYVSAGRRDKGVHQAGFLVLRQTSMPSVLTELGFISNPTEEAFLNSSEGVNKLAESLYKGFCSYRRQLAGISEPVSADNNTQLAAVTNTTDDAKAARIAAANHTGEGATQDVTEDDVPSIRPVKTIPYPTTPAKAETKHETPAKQEAPAAEKPKAEAKTEPKVAVKTEPKPEPKTETKPAAKTEPKPAAKTETKPAAKTEAKPAAKTETKPAAKTETKPAAKTETKPAAKTEAKPTAKTETKPAAKTETKPAAKTEAKPAAKTEAKPAAKTETKPAAKTETKPATKAETKPAAKTETKPATKTEAKPAAKTDAKTEAKPAAKAETKTETKPAAKTDAKPIFKVQIFSSSTEVKAGSSSLKGLPAEYFKEGGKFKYTYGKSTNYNDIVKMKAAIKDKFPDAFIVAFLDGKPIKVSLAIELCKQK